MSVDEVSARHQARHEDGHYRRIGADHGWQPACMDAGGEGADLCGQRRANYDEVLEDPLVAAAPGRCAISRLARHLPRYDEVIAPSGTLAAHVAVSKFAWQLPFNRQAQILAGHSITLDRETLGFRVARVAWWLKPLYDPLLAFIRSQPGSPVTRRPWHGSIRGASEPSCASSGLRRSRSELGGPRRGRGYILAESHSAREIAWPLATFGGVLQ